MKCVIFAGLISQALFAGITLEPPSVSLVQEVGKPASTRVTVTHPGISSIEARPVAASAWLRFACAPLAVGMTNCDITADATALSAGNHRAEILLSGGGETSVLSVGIEVLSRGGFLSIWPPRLDMLRQPRELRVAPLRLQTPGGLPAQIVFPRLIDCMVGLPEGSIPAPSWATAQTIVRAEQFAPSECTCILRQQPPGAGTLEFPVTLRESEMTYSVLPQVADGGGFRTRITLVNTSSQPAQAKLLWFRERNASGETEAWQPAVSSAVDWRGFELQPGATAEFETLGGGASPTSGWVKVESEIPLKGLAVYRQKLSDGRDQEASVPLVRERMTRFWVPFDQRQGLNTAVAIANACPKAAKLDARLIDEQGRYSSIYSLGVLPALGHRAAVLPDWFAESREREGTVEFVGEDGCIVPLALRFTPGGAFTSITPQPPLLYNQSSVVFPQVADGGGFKTTFVLTNPNPSPATFIIDFHPQVTAGQSTAWKPLPIERITLEPLASASISTAGLDSKPTSGWAQVYNLINNVEGVAVFSLSTERGLQEAAVRSSAKGISRAVIPYDNRGGVVTSLAIANGGFSTVNTSWTIRDASGLTISNHVLSLPPQSQQTFEMPRRFPESAGLSGSLLVSSPAEGVHILPLRFTGGGAFTSLPVQAQ